MRYYDLPVRCAPPNALGIDIKPHFYHAFDMDVFSLNYARKKSTRRKNRAETSSSIMKRRRTSSSSSQPSPPPSVTTKRRVSFSPND